MTGQMKAYWRITSLLACAIVLSPLAHADPEAPISREEMAATLRDMIFWPRMFDQIRKYTVVSPTELNAAFQPQSQWGRDLVTMRQRAWNDAMHALVTGLKKHGDLDAALSNNGIIIPIQSRTMEQKPEYYTVDDLLHFVNLYMCNHNADQPECFLSIKLAESGGAYSLEWLRILREDGALVDIPGRVQR